jgi:hypothetical protein
MSTEGDKADALKSGAYFLDKLFLSGRVPRDKIL